MSESINKNTDIEVPKTSPYIFFQKEISAVNVTPEYYVFDFPSNEQIKCKKANIVKFYRSLFINEESVAYNKEVIHLLIVKPPFT